MDDNLVFLWLVTIVWLSAWRNIKRLWGMGQRGWMGVYFAIFAITAAGVVLWYPRAGQLSALAMALFWFLPMLLQRRVFALSSAQNYAGARRLSWLVALLHPADGYLEQPKFYDALDAFKRGDLARAESTLTELSKSKRLYQRMHAIAHLQRLRGDWRGYLEQAPEPDPTRDPTGLVNTMRALGETGQLDALVALYARHKEALADPVMVMQRPLARLYLAAFCGQRAVLEQLIAGPLSGMHKGTQDYWRATCAYALGDAEQAEPLLHGLVRDASDVLLARGAQSRIESPNPRADELLSEANREELRLLERRVAHETRYIHAPIGAAFVTRTLVVLNLIGFGIEEWLGGSTNEAVLYHAGALVEGGFTWAESYRVVTAMFLHAGALHLAMNMLGLAAIAPFVEGTLGRLRFALVYFAAGLTGMLIHAIVLDSGGLVLGASGCIMGLVGATAAILLEGYRADKAQVAKERLPRIGFALLLQLSFDLVIPGISLTAHWSGVAVGFVLTYVLCALMRRTALTKSAAAL